MAGRKPESFTEKENQALRGALRKLKEERGWSQAEAGRQLGRGQQTAGTLLNGGGFSRPTAMRLAELLGYDSPEVLLRDLGASADHTTVDRSWGDRELAVAIGRRLGYDEEVLRRVAVKFQEDHYKSRPARWWNDRIVVEAAEQAAAKLAAPEPAAKRAEKTEKVTEHARPRRKRAG